VYLDRFLNIPAAGLPDERPPVPGSDSPTALLELFTRTRAIRRGIIEAGQDTQEADFGRPHGHED
jgi:hypothetical protein